MSKILNSSLILLLLLALAVVPAWAQFALRGGIDGIVVDPSKAVMPGVSITLKDLDRNQTSTTTTNDSGAYSFRNLNPGNYQITIEHTGFRRVVSPVLKVASQQIVRMDFDLEVGEVNQTVDVTGAAPLLQTQQSDVGAVADRTMVDSLPIKGRNFKSFAVLSPNISVEPRDNTGDTWEVGGHQTVGGVNYTVGGGGDNAFYMNGVNINENWVGGSSYAPSQEAIGEVKIDVANFSAESGRDPSVLNIATRGGTSTFHGSAFDSLQNGSLNAWNPYDKSQMSPDQKKGFLQRNQFGGNIGGPVYIPKLLTQRDKAFFFFNFERMIDNYGGDTAIYRVPTEAERNGDFSALLERFPGDPNYVLYDPYSTTYDADGNSVRTAVPNNDLRNVTRPDGSPLVDPNAKKLLDLFPMPNGYSNPNNPNSLENYQTFQSTKNLTYRMDMRFDYSFNSSNNVYVSVNKSSGLGDNKGGLFPLTPSNVSDTSYLVSANYAHVFSPHLTNEFIFGMGEGRMLTADQATLDYFSDPANLRNQTLKNTLTVGQGILGIDWAGYGKMVKPQPTVPGRSSKPLILPCSFQTT